MNLSLLLLQTARTLPQRPAVFIGDRVYLSFAQLADRMASLAGRLVALGVSPGDRVMTYAPNDADYITVMWASWFAGAVLVPVNSKLHPKELAYMVRHCGPKVLFAAASLQGSASQAIAQSDCATRLIALEEIPDLLGSGGRSQQSQPAPRAESEPAWIFYTSGTTGRPKGATLSHRNLMAMTLRYFADVDFVNEDDTMFHLAPLSHGSGLYSIPLLARGAAQVVPESQGFDEDEVFDLLRHHRKVTTFLAPTMVNRLVRHPGATAVEPGRWQTIFYGGAPMYVSDIKRGLDAFGPVFWQGYGQGESPCTITALSKRDHADTAHPQYEERLGSAGTARTGVEVRVVDEDGRALPPGEVGEVRVRSEVTMTGYWGDPDATQSTLREGWLCTGDLGAFSDDGYLTLKDRSKDVVISGGSNIYPREVEEVLLTHPAVREVSVIGVPDAEWGEAVVAYVVANGDAASPGDLDLHCQSEMARFKRPKQYRFVAELPKSAYGKILKAQLRQSWAREHEGVARTPSNP